MGNQKVSKTAGQKFQYQSQSILRGDYYYVSQIIGGVQSVDGRRRAEKGGVGLKFLV